jgi:5-methylcytosine-specific restriction endonuclease McrA
MSTGAKKTYYQRNKEEIKAYQKRYTAQNREAVTARQRRGRRKRAERNYAYLRDILEQSECGTCGFREAVSLVFHHPPEVDKISPVSRMAGVGRSLDIIKAEVAKCVVLCQNCHRELHAKDRYDLGDGTAGLGAPDIAQKRVREQVREYRVNAGGCSRCDEQRPLCLTLCRIEGKGRSIGKMVAYRMSWEEIEPELHKFVVLCWNCTWKAEMERRALISDEMEVPV